MSRLSSYYCDSIIIILFVFIIIIILVLGRLNLLNFDQGRGERLRDFCLLLCMTKTFSPCGE